VALPAVTEDVDCEDISGMARLVALDVVMVAAVGCSKDVTEATGG
jgi:hypothetical protein